jgi:very-short-patch-repair endonuclease
MSIKSLYFEYKRRQRIRNPEKHDHCSYMLTGIMGADWWISHGFERELVEGRCNIDFGNRALKIAIEGDGRAYHTQPMDVIADANRDKFLQGRGWYVMRFPYEKLRDKPAKVRQDILAAYEDFKPVSKAQREATLKMMKRSGF